MLNFIYGRAATGKTTAILSKIKESAQKGEEVIFIVPEQFSFESERAVLALLGDKLSHSVTVLSFSSLADTLTRLCGGGARGVLTDADKILFMNKTLLALRDELYIWRRYLASPGFASKVVDMIGEFKVSAIFPDDLDKVCEKLDASALKEKIKALSLVYRTYDAMLSGRFIDPADKLDKLYNDLKNYKFFSNKTVFIDGFKGFTGQQYRIIDVILATAKSVTVAALCDSLLKKEKLNLFSNTVAAVAKIAEKAPSYRVKIGESLHLEAPHYESCSMEGVERLLSGNSTVEENGQDVTLCVAKTVADEVSFTARNIRRLVRENGYRYKDFVIIARNPQDYENAIEREFADNDISCFFDKRIPLTVSPLYTFIDAALKCAKSFDTEEVFRFVKTGLSCDMTDEEVSALENYTFLWNISGKGWYEKWDMDPTGFSETKEEKSEEIKAVLGQLDSLRHKAIDPLLSLRADLGETVKEKAAAIIKLIDFCKTGEKMNGLLSFMRNDFSPEDIDALRQSWDLIMSALDGIVRCFGDESVTVEQFADMFSISCEMTTVGRIPQMLDEVTFGAADRIRPSRPKVAFILGANQGVFPKAPENSSILGNTERRILNDCGLEVRNKTLFQTVEENQLVYSCVCCPSQLLFVTCNQTDISGTSMEPAGFFLQLSESLKKVKRCVEPIEELTSDNLPETGNAAFRALFNFAGGNKNGTSTLIEAVLCDEDKRVAYYDTVNAAAGYEKKLSEENAKKLFGDNIYVSPTKVEAYHGCHFKFFCKYGLNTSVLQAAKLDVLQRGTIIHFVIEQFCNNHMADIGSVSEAQIKAEANQYIMEYFALVQGSEFLFTARFKFLLRKMAEGLEEVLGRIVREFAQSEFRPEKCEVTIGNNGTIPTVEFPFGKNGRLSLSGSIDRLDTWGSFVRIVDYKTGTKEFRLADTLYGLNLQMLMYLYCVVRGNNPDYRGKNPAGILYFPSKKDLKKEGLRMNGLICDNISVIEAMEKENAGEFIPCFKINKDGTPSKTNYSFIPEVAFDTIFDYIEALAAKMGEGLHRGDISVDPIESSKDSACTYCDYKTVCGREDEECRKVENNSKDEVLIKMRGDDESGL